MITLSLKVTIRRKLGIMNYISKLIMAKKTKTTQQKKKTIKNKLDKLIQQIFIPKHPFCLVCGAPTSEGHHFVQKTQSMFLRWLEINMVPLCRKCHMMHHFSGDLMIVATISEKKGKEWLDYIQLHRRDAFDDSLGNLKELFIELKEKEFGLGL